MITFNTHAHVQDTFKLVTLAYVHQYASETVPTIHSMYLLPLLPLYMYMYMYPVPGTQSPT